MMLLTQSVLFYYMLALGPLSLFSCIHYVLRYLFVQLKLINTF